MLPSPDSRVLVLTRDHPEGALIEVYNFSEDLVELPAYVLRDRLGTTAVEQISGFDYSLEPGADGDRHPAHSPMVAKPAADRPARHG